MTELAWITIAGKRVLPVLGHAGMCGTSGARHERINCAFYGTASGDCLAPNSCDAYTFPNDAIFITEDQLPEYLGRKLIGSL
jgi:hypothetical protein